MSLPRRDIGRAYLDALDKEPKAKPATDAASEPASEPVTLAGEGPRQNGVSYGTRSAMRRLLTEAEEHAKAQQRTKPRPRRWPPWLTVLAAAAASCTVGFLLGRISHEPARRAGAVQTMTIPAGHYYCARCRETHPKPASAVGNPRTWCPKASLPTATPGTGSRAATIPDRARRFRSSTRLP